MNFRKILWRLFTERSASFSGETINLGNVRYIPRATGARPGNWMIWDRQKECFVSEDEAKVLGEELLSATLLN